MGALTPSYFARSIAECRALFNKRSRGFPRWFGLGARPIDDDAEQIHKPMRPHYEILANQGRVVWGCVAQVNRGMFAPGPHDLPGVTVYSADPHYDANPQDLLAVGRACFRFKNTEPVDAEFKDVAARLTDEFDQTLRMALPKRLTDARAVFLAGTMFHRARLPDGVLRGSLVPLVIAPDATEANMILQLPYWSKTLRDSWDTLQNKLQSLEVASTARQVAEAGEKRPAKRRPVDLGADAAPISLTPAMANLYASIVKRHHPGTRPFLVIGLHEDGTKYAEFADDYDRSLQCAFKSNGVPVAIRKDQRERLRGTIVDYQETTLAKGVVIRLPGE